MLVELNENSELKLAKLCDLGVSKELTETTIADTLIGTTR